MVPTVRLTLRTGRSSRTLSPDRSAPSLSWIRVLSSACSSPWSWVVVQCREAPSGSSGLWKIGRRSSPWVFQWCTARVDVEDLGLPDGLLDRPEAELGEVLADLLRDEPHEVHDVLGPPVEPLAQLRVLRRDADGAGVEVADAHHDAARDHQRRGREAELLRAEQRGDDDVAAGLELAVGLHDDPVAQAVDQQRLLGLGQAQLPRRARVLDRASAGRRRCRRRARR